MKKKRFTKKQIQHWLAYEDVRSGGSYNMFDPRARHLTGLSSDEYSFVMRNYSELGKAADAASKQTKR